MYEEISREDNTSNFNEAGQSVALDEQGNTCCGYEPAIGNIDGYTVGGVVGWVQSEIDHHPLIEIVDQDGVVVGCTTADLHRADLSVAGHTGYGFSVRVGRRLSDCPEKYSIAVDGKFWASLDSFRNVPNIYDVPAIINNPSFLTGIIKRRLSGHDWPVVKAKSCDLEGQASVHQIIDEGNNVLQFRVSGCNRGNRWATVNVFVDDVLLCERGLIRSSTLESIIPENTGSLDTVGPFFVTGWMIDTPAGERALEILVDGEKVGLAKANRPRLDIEERFGFANTAFAWPIPKRFKDGRPHVYIARRKSDGRVLAKSGRTAVLGAGRLEMDSHENGLGVMLRSPFYVESSHLELRIDGVVVSSYPLLTHEEGEEYVSYVVIHWQEALSGIGAEVDVNVPEYSLQASVPQQLLISRLGALRGNIDTIANRHASGWISYVNEQSITVPVLVFVDGEEVASGKASYPRPDLAKVGFTNINHGFRVELPEWLFTGIERAVSIRCAVTGKILQEQNFYFTTTVRKRSLSANSSKLWQLTRPGAVPESTLAGDMPLVTIIILTRDGAPVLKSCLESIAQYTDPQLAKIVVVDHNSLDETPTVVASAAKRLNISYQRRRGNGSFSYSNNEVAFEADTPFVLFLNNDVILTSNAVESLVQMLIKDNTVGAVGCKLLEAREGFDMRRTKVHHAGIALNLEPDGRVRAREIGEELSISEANRPIDVYGVTGACLAMRTEEFRAIGGFPDLYFYGGEDVELSVRVRTDLGKRVVCQNDVLALHYRGYARLTDRGAALLPRLHENERRLNERLGYYNRKSYQKSVLAGRDNVSLHRGVIGFVVLEADRFARAGEYFTAAELAFEYEALTGCSVVFITPDTDWYDVSGIDCLVVMLHEYDVTQIHGKKPNMLLAAWARNHFDFWLESANLDHFDIILSSSAAFADQLRKKRGRHAKNLRIATRGQSMASGTETECFKADVTFNGNYAGAGRDLSSNVDPAKFVGKFLVIGKGWEDHKNLAECWRGAADYESMPAVYASTKIVIDDANPSARAWGGTNSRVFDALAAGCLVVTNSEATSRIDFDGLLPVWHNLEELYEVVNRFLGDDLARKELVTKLRSMVLEQHTYAQRALTLQNHLVEASGPIRIAIKIGAPTRAQSAEWGDLYFAEALAAGLRGRGYNVRIDCLDEWYNRQQHDDIAIVLRGLSRYQAQSDQINLMWVISHPESVSQEELKAYDHVFCSSENLAQHLGSQVETSVLQQFSDFKTDESRQQPTETLDSQLSKIFEHVGPTDILFVGNTRGVRRQFVLDVHKKHGVKFIGKGWDLYVSTDHIIAEHIENYLLPSIYRTAGCVLNDHWPDMKQQGVISNRVFDVLSAGGFVLSDHVADGVKLFGPDYFCLSVEDFSRRWERVQADPSHRDDLIARGQAIVDGNHRAEDRVQAIDSVIQRIHADRMAKGVKA